MKRLAFVVIAMAGLASVAHSADLPTKKTGETPPAPPPDCFSSLWTYLNSSISDCPLTYAGITLYGNLDGSYGYETHGAPGNPSADKVNYVIQKNSGDTHWLWSPNALSTSVIGIKMKEDLGYGWSLIGVIEAGFNPYSGMLINGPRSRTDNNVNKTENQTANFDSSRLCRLVRRLRQQPYRPLEHRLHLSIDLSVAAQAQVGGYNVGNASNGQYQVQLGADFGDLTVDGVANWTKDAAALASYSGSPPAGYDVNSVLKATLSNAAGVELMARYKWGQFKFYGGYIYARLMNPSDNYPDGFPTIAQGIFVPPGAVTSNAYNVNRILITVWTGVRYSVWSNLDLAAAHDYLPAPAVCTGTGINISSSKCAGREGAVSFLIDYKPVKRVDLYAGVMVSDVWGGVANGYLYPQNIDPTVGLRIRF